MDRGERALVPGSGGSSSGGGTAAAAPAPAAPAPLAAAPASPDLRARIYVKDLGHLAELVREDARVSPMARKLASRRKAAIGVMVVGGLASVVAMGAGAAEWGKNDDPSDPDFMERSSGDRLFVGGVIGALATGLVGAAIYPRRGEVLDVINAWNTAHPDRPFEIRSGHVDR